MDVSHVKSLNVTEQTRQSPEVTGPHLKSQKNPQSLNVSDEDDQSILIDSNVEMLIVYMALPQTLLKLSFHHEKLQILLKAQIISLKGILTFNVMFY